MRDEGRQILYEENRLCVVFNVTRYNGWEEQLTDLIRLRYLWKTDREVENEQYLRFMAKFSKLRLDIYPQTGSAPTALDIKSIC